MVIAILSIGKQRQHWNVKTAKSYRLKDFKNSLINYFFPFSDFLTAPPKVSPKLPKGPLSQGELLSPEQQLEQE